MTVDTAGEVRYHSLTGGLLMQSFAPKVGKDADKSLNCVEFGEGAVAVGGNEGKLSVFDEATGKFNLDVKSGGA